MAYWGQQPNSLLDTAPKVGEWGFSPVVWNKPKPKQNVYNDHVLRNQVCFQALYGTPMLEWWPRHEDDILVTHLYRLIDELHCTAVHQHRPSEAMSHRLQEDQNVNFADEVVRQQALKHVDKMSEGKVYERPFLSCSKSLESLAIFASSKTTKATSKSANIQLVQIDLAALHMDGMFSEDPLDERPQIQAMSHSQPMYAFLTGICSASSQQLFKETGRKFRHRRVSWEDMRMFWILWFNEALAMRWVFCDETYVSYGEKSLVRENEAHSEQRLAICPYVDSARQLPPVEVLFKAAPNWRDWRGVHEDQAIPALIHVQTQCKGSYRALDMVDLLENNLPPCGSDYESRVVCVDSFGVHMDTAVAAVIESRGHIPLIHVGGTTGYQQVNDTHLHIDTRWLRRWRKHYGVHYRKPSARQAAE